MAKRRTRREKEQAKHNLQPMYSLGETAVNLDSSGYPVAAPAVAGFELHTDTGLIKGDIVKSVLLSFMILMIEVGIYLYWQRI